ncbi:MAG: phosphatase PAP2 family protein, partial [Myxococcales bacterium]
MWKLVGRNALYVAPLATVNTAGYLLLNHFPLRAPVELPLTGIDTGTPFLLWTIWIYAALLLADVVLPVLVRDRAIFFRMLGAYGIAIGLNFLVWSVYPTVYPRPEVALDDSLSAAAYRLLLTMDTPACAFPSGHITIPAVACWGLSLDRPKAAPWLWAGLALTSISILTTKQHYLADLFGGLGTALAGVVLS